MLSVKDPDIYNAIEGEKKRQQECLEMIPSENPASPAVLEALGSVLCNKYSEGYPGKRYYGGNEFADVVERTAIDRAKKLFGVTHANVQPYSGSPANQAVCFALLNPGDKVMGLHLLYGGHLTHGWKVNFSAVYYNSVQYTTNADGWLDYDAIAEQVDKEKPKLIFAGATAYPREFDFKKFHKIAKSVDAYFIADTSHITGLIIAGVHQPAVNNCDVVTSTTHKTLRGPRGAIILCDGEPSEPLKQAPERSRRYLPTLIDRAIFPGLQGGPHNHQTAAIAVALGEAMKPEFKEYGTQIVKNCKILANILMDNGFKLVTDGTDNHMILADMRSKNMSGKDAETVLDRAGITVNKNTIPFDPNPPYNPSGIRLGTPFLTSRGMKEEQMERVGQLITEAIKNNNMATEIKEKVKKLCSEFPLYE